MNQFLWTRFCEEGHYPALVGIVHHRCDILQQPHLSNTTLESAHRRRTLTAKKLAPTNRLPTDERQLHGCGRSFSLCKKSVGHSAEVVEMITLNQGPRCAVQHQPAGSLLQRRCWQREKLCGKLWLDINQQSQNQSYVGR